VLLLHVDLYLFFSVVSLISALVGEMEEHRPPVRQPLKQLNGFLQAEIYAVIVSVND
jgi:hypothetical protein